MKKLLLLLLIISSSAFAQSEAEPSYLSVNWKVGDVKTIYQVDSTIIYVEDTVYLATAVRSKYAIEVVSLHDTLYEVKYRKITLDTNAHVSSQMKDVSDLKVMMQNLLLVIQEKINSMEYSFLVDQQTGLALKIKDEDQLEKDFEEIVVVVLNQFLDSDKIQVSQDKKDQIKLKVKKVLAEKMPAVIATMINQFNQIFQVYSMPYSKNSTYVLPTQIYLVDEMKFGKKEVDGEIIMHNKMVGSNAQMDYQTKFEDGYAYNMYVVANGKENEIPQSEFSEEQITKCTVNLVSSWITSFSNFITIKMGNQTTYQATYIKIK